MEEKPGKHAMLSRVCSNSYQHIVQEHESCVARQQKIHHRTWENPRYKRAGRLPSPSQTGAPSRLAVPCPCRATTPVQSTRSFYLTHSSPISVGCGFAFAYQVKGPGECFDWHGTDMVQSLKRNHKRPPPWIYMTFNRLPNEKNHASQPPPGPHSKTFAAAKEA
jgi:hypothetical protein